MRGIASVLAWLGDGWRRRPSRATGGDGRQADALAAQARRYEVLLDTVGELGEGIAILDRSRFVYANDAACRITGYTREELLALPSFRVLFDAEDADAIAARVDAAIPGELLTTAAEASIVRPDGTTLVVELSAKVVDDDGDQVIAVCRDISERKRAEALELERLRALDRMKGAFLNAVSHELRTPLTVMLGMAQTVQLRRGGLTPDQIEELLAGLVRNARKLDRLLNELLDLDRLNRGILEPHRRPTDIARLVTGALDETGIVENRPVTSDVERVVVDLDGPKVERIVENLLFNAERHTAPGTPIWVTARLVDDGLELVVADGGAGVPAELRETIFEPFRQAPTDGMPSGVGIGLSLVARFAELHGGQAWVAERDGGGAAFHVHLPCQAAAATATERALVG